MQCSFRPVAFRLPLSDVAALAAATVGALFRPAHSLRAKFRSGFRLPTLAPGTQLQVSDEANGRLGQAIASRGAGPGSMASRVL